MLDIADIFKQVISNGYYRGYNSNTYMCMALGWAAHDGLITKDELALANKAIDDYIGNSIFLKDVLDSNNLPSAFEDRKAIYIDWHNRPELKPEPE